MRVKDEYLQVRTADYMHMYYMQVRHGLEYRSIIWNWMQSRKTVKHHVGTRLCIKPWKSLVFTRANGVGVGLAQRHSPRHSQRGSGSVEDSKAITRGNKEEKTGPDTQPELEA